MPGKTGTKRNPQAERQRIRLRISGSWTVSLGELERFGVARPRSTRQTEAIFQPLRQFAVWSFVAQIQDAFGHCGKIKAANRPGGTAMCYTLLAISRLSHIRSQIRSSNCSH